MSRLLYRSIVEITQQQDCETLQHVMLNEIISLYQPQQLSFYVVQGSAPDTLLQPVFNYSKQVSSDNCLDCFVDDADSQAQPPDEYAITAITDKQCVSVESDAAVQHIYMPVCMGEKVISLLELALPDVHTIETNELQFFIQVYENFYAVLNEGERDTLTGLFNRRTFDAKLNKMLVSQRQQKLKKLSVTNTDEQRHLFSSAHAWLAAIDVDFFKRVNDEFGHVVGDEVLLRLAQKMRRCFRSSDLLFRFGGEEFVVVLEPISFEMAKLALERFRATVESCSFPLVGKVTISIGFAKIEENDFPVTILDYADKALYYAKAHGRNSVYSFEQLLDEGALTLVYEDGSVDLF